MPAVDEGADLRERGRSAYRKREWANACALLSAADRESPLEPDDLELLVTAAYLTGRDDTGEYESPQNSRRSSPRPPRCSNCWRP